MNKLHLHNTLTGRKEEFKPIKKGQVGLYTCGPTVYNYAHIGNLRTYVFEDILKRTLVYNGYKVKHVMNITDVGHLVGDRDMGEDKLEKGAEREGKSARDIAEFYLKAFKDDLNKLNIIEPDTWIKATKTIKEQIELIKKLENKGFTYETSDGIYYDTSKFKDYNKLSHLKLEDLKEGARVEKNEEKRNPTDFALWKFSPQGVKRQQEWNPKEYGADWKIGFPGWHIECSAMSMAELGDQLDIHCGGIDHINVHHTNEIAQSEAATGKKFFNFWLHGAFLNIAGGKKMAKSEANFLTLANALVKKGIDPLVFRFACLQTHYRKPMEYSEEAMKNAEKGLKNLLEKFRRLIPVLFNKQGLVRNWVDSGFIDDNFNYKFTEAINDDLDTPRTLMIVNELLSSNLEKSTIFQTMSKFNDVLGLGLGTGMTAEIDLDEIKKIEPLLEKRLEVRENKDFKESDRLRDEIEKLGYIVEDTKDGQRISKK